jgi:type IV pilus assembly protein PilQ
MGKINRITILFFLIISFFVPSKSYVQAANTEGAISETLSVDFFKIDLHNVFRLLGHVSGKNIAVDESITGTITLQMQDVSWRTVLDVVKDLKGLDSYERDNVLVILPLLLDTDPKSKRIAEYKESQQFGASSISMEYFEPSEESKIKVDSMTGGQVAIDTIVKAQEFLKKADDMDKKGNKLAALEFYKKAAEIWQDNHELLKKIAIIALSQKNDEITAVNYGKLALKANPRDSEASSLVAIALARMAKNNEAKIYFERSMDGENITSQILYNYAVFAFSQGMYNDVIRIANKIETGFTITPEIMLIKAQTYEILNNRNAALNEYNSIVNLGSGVSPHIKQIAQLKLQELLKSQQN